MTPYAEGKFTSWRRAVGPYQWRTLAAALLGWTLDGMNMMLYALALTTIQKDFALSSAMAGLLVSLTLITSAVGGVFGGYFSDRYGRSHVLVFSILLYSVFTAVCATAPSVWWLALWRSMVGFGMGAVWSSGSVLVAETWPAKHRGKAIGFMQAGWAIGYMLAAMLAAVILPSYGWRPLFLMGLAPSFLAIWVWFKVPEPELWRELAQAGSTRARLSTMRQSGVAKRIVIAATMCGSVQFAYWGLFTWLPAYLSSPASQGGAGMTIVRTSAWIVPAQVGAFLGYTSFGFLADRFGRRPVFQFFVFAAAVLVPIYGLAGKSQLSLLLLGPAVGFFAHGYFSVFGAMLAELFPLGIRGTAQGISYNAGRAFGALAPVIIGAIASRHGIGGALAVTSTFFVFGGIAVRFLPETKGEALQ